MVDSTRHKLHCLGEQVIQEAHEDTGVIGCQLAQIEITQSSQEYLQMIIPCFQTQCTSTSMQMGTSDISGQSTPVVFPHPPLPERS